ncbi:MAG: hypothetical protein JWR59_93 [Brevundimonas sp.]|nr:hypothetical protein [Brevundimonas sp.]
MLTRAPLRDAGGYSPMTVGALEAGAASGQARATRKFPHHVRDASQSITPRAATTPDANEACNR